MFHFVKVQNQSDTSFVRVQITAGPHASSSSAATILYKGDVEGETGELRKED